jgi:hypothetical protein
MKIEQDIWLRLRSICVTMRDKNTAKTASNSTFDELKRIAWRAFIYQVSRVLRPFKWMVTITVFEFVLIEVQQTF